MIKKLGKQRNYFNNTAFVDDDGIDCNILCVDLTAEENEPFQVMCRRKLGGKKLLTVILFNKRIKLHLWVMGIDLKMQSLQNIYEYHRG